ncbi:hypothetical protein C8R43DRAFT_1097295 [Mycena crocata]|nr:hypothetical protein C8R43DRAFT_1097295 [Mycena crocata]
MSLPTPPNTSHREKENRAPFAAPHVIWSPHNQYRTINPIPPQVPLAASASKAPPRSILKKRSEPLLPLVNLFQRETTPEPSQPKLDPNYLSSPVATIVDSAASLDDLIRAYSVLAARIRAHITLAAASDASWPILEPLRKNRTALEEAIIRDIARCLVDPETMDQTPEDREEEECLKEHPVLLPSPKNSPKKKKKGTTARKAKYGRDLCTTCHSVIKLLAVVFTLPAVSGVFTFPQLRSILTQVLAIPLADELPTPNARKTYALSIWLLQSQRLPAVVLEKAADRIAFALRRGIEGELGKEGKKGSASDGLKAIHDLSVYQPSIFVPRFEALLPSVMSNLLAPTVAIRAQACHALGGLARGLAMLPVCSLHTRISAIVTTILNAVSASPSKKSPSKPACNESPLVRTLRTTLQATEVQHVSQGPVWGLSVLASLLILANSAAYAHPATRRVFIALLNRAMSHKKSSIRSLGCTVWRCVAWAYCQPMLPGNGDDESEVEDEDDASSKRKASGLAIEQSREAFWVQLVVTVVDMGVGLSVVASLLEEAGRSSEEMLTRVAVIMKGMTARGGPNIDSAIDTLARMVSFEPPETEWNWNKLLPRGLFSASPGLLTADYTSLESPVRAVIAQCPGLHDVRSLPQDEVAQPVIFEKLVEIWKECLGSLGLQDDEEIPPNILLIWDNLIQANVSALRESDAPDTDVAEFAIQAIEILVDILQDDNIDVTLKAGEVRFCTDGPEMTNSLSNAALKLKIVRALWGKTRQVVSSAQLMPAGEKMIVALMDGEGEFTDSDEVSRTEWAMFCAEVLIVSDPDYLQEFWNHDWTKSKWEWTNAVRSNVWRSFVEIWKEESGCLWQGIVTLLAVPFTAPKFWDLSDSDHQHWQVLLERGIDKGLDYGLNKGEVLDHVAGKIVKEHNPTSTTASFIADTLLSQLDMAEVHDLPESLFEFVNDALRSSYPPEPRNKQQTLWTLRSLVGVIDACPPEHVLEVLHIIEGGLRVWISDEHEALTEEEYTFDIVSLYGYILVAIQSVPLNISVLETLGPILESGFVRRESAAAITDAFAQFWSDTYATYPVPEDGWPAEIQTCLGIPSSEVEDDPWNKVSLSPAFRGEQMVSDDGEEVPVGSPFKLGAARFRSWSPEIAHTPGGAPALHEVAASLPCRPVTPTTPITARSRASTPPRPHKLPSAAQSSPKSPDSPLHAPYPQPPGTPATPKRTPLRLVHGSKPSPNKRRKLDLENKENESPGLLIASVVERITAASPKSGHDLAMSKKHTSPNHREEERPSKRSKREADGDGLSFHHRTSDAEEEERLVELSLVERVSLSPTAAGSFGVGESYTPLSKKRKRVLLDAVEVPSVQQVYSDVRDVLPFAFATPSKQDWAQTRSTSKAMRRVSAPADSPSILRKRRRESVDISDDPFSDDSRSSKPMSSDDDAFFGQVTPHHVFSPALRARDDDPPSSDDSNMSASPLKGVLSRRLQRAASYGRVVVVPLSTR